MAFVCPLRRAWAHPNHHSEGTPKLKTFWQKCIHDYLDIYLRWQFSYICLSLARTAWLHISFYSFHSAPVYLLGHWGGISPLVMWVSFTHLGFLTYCHGTCFHPCSYYGVAIWSQLRFGVKYSKIANLCFIILALVKLPNPLSFSLHLVISRSYYSYHEITVKLKWHNVLLQTAGVLPVFPGTSFIHLILYLLGILLAPGPHSGSRNMAGSFTR